MNTVAAWDYVVSIAQLGVLGGYVWGRLFLAGCALRGEVRDLRLPTVFAVTAGLACGLYAALWIGLARLPAWLG